MTKKKFKVSLKDVGQRLDLKLTTATGRSRSYWQQQLKLGRVQISGQLGKASRLLELGDVIEIELSSPVFEASFELDLPVIYQDGDIIVVDKPAGLLVHPTARSHEATVVDFARAYTTDPDPLRPGIVHRLDRDTSGLLLIAKHPEAKAYLQKLFKSHQIQKTYLTLVHGRLHPAEAIIKLPVGQSRHQHLKKIISLGGKEAITRYRVIREYTGYSLLEVMPTTGRTHQLRIHLSYLGHPIAGDGLYGNKVRPIGLGRQFLHAARLTFRAPNGKELMLESPLPPDLKHFLDSVEA